jgi:hypothetical protein
MMPIDFNFFFLPLYRTKNHLTENLNWGCFFPALSHGTLPEVDSTNHGPYSALTAVGTLHVEGKDMGEDYDID